MEAIAPERRPIGAAARLPCRRFDHVDGRGGSIAPGRRGRPRGWRSGSAADTTGLERLGFCVAGPEAVVCQPRRDDCRRGKAIAATDGSTHSRC